MKETVKAKFPDAELVSAEKEKADGKTVYEIAIKNKSQSIEVTVSEEGAIVSIEKQIELKDLPKPVAEAFAKKYPNATVKIVEEVTEGEKVKFELLIAFGDKKLEVSFDPQGKLLQEEDKSKEKEEKK